MEIHQRDVKSNTTVADSGLYSHRNRKWALSGGTKRGKWLRAQCEY